MKFISYLDNNVTSLGYLLDFDNRVVNISKISPGTLNIVDCDDNWFQEEIFVAFAFSKHCQLQKSRSR